MKTILYLIGGAMAGFLLPFILFMVVPIMGGNDFKFLVVPLCHLIQNDCGGESILGVFVLLLIVTTLVGALFGYGLKKMRQS